MTEKERYKRVFDMVASSGMEAMEVNWFMNRKKKLSYRNRAAAAIAAVGILTCSSGAVYAANIGGIQRTIQVWVYGDQTKATIEISAPEGSGSSYSIMYEAEEGTVTGIVTYDIPDNAMLEADGADVSVVGETEQISVPGVSYEEDGTVWVSYYDQRIEVSDLFEDGICYVKLVYEDETLYMTIRYADGWAVSTEKYISPDSFQ